MYILIRIKNTKVKYLRVFLIIGSLLLLALNAAVYTSNYYVRTIESVPPAKTISETIT